MHAAGDSSRRTAASSGISRGGRTAKPLGELLEKSAPDVVGRNMDGIGDAHHNKRTLGRHGEARVRGIKTGPRCLLDLLDSSTGFPDDGANQNVGDQKTERVGLGVVARGLSQGLVVQGSNDQAKSL